MHSVEDLSGLGLLLNGEPVRGARQSLGGGDRISIGGERIFVTDGTEARLPALGQPGSGTSLVIGSSHECDVLLDHPAVSPVHAVIEHRSGGAFVRDHSAGANLLVNGRPVGRDALAPGSELAVGPFRLLFDGSTVIARETAGGRLDVCEVSRQIRGRPILQPTTFSVAPGELVAIIGASGAGKSTLLRILAATDSADGGEVVLGGEPIGLRREELGYVPQDEIVHRELTVREALHYAAALRLPGDAGAARIDAAAEAIAAELGLLEHAETVVADLSGGQRKRVGVATELVNRPSSLLLDEPTTGLDPALERKAMSLLRRLAAGERSVVLVTHATQSLTLCDRILVLGGAGETCFYGPPKDALDFFGVREFEGIYAELEQRPASQWSERFERRPHRSDQRAFTEVAAKAGPTTGSRRLPRRPVTRELGTLVSRYVRVFTRDRKNLLLLLGQAPLLGLLAGAIFSSGALSDPDRARDTANLLFLLTTISVWMGAISASREAVRERGLMLREAAIGVRVTSYLGSKLTILTALVTVQVGAMALCAFLIQRPDASPAEIAAVFACLLLAGYVAVALGLAISAYARTENQATTLIPLALIPQLLLGGAIVAIASMSTAMKAVAALIFTRWMFAGAGSMYDMNERIAADSAFGKVSEYGPSFFRLEIYEVVVLAALFAAVFIAAATVLIRRASRTGAQQWRWT